MAGIVEEAFVGLFTKQCEVAHVEAIGPYRLIRLRGPSLRDAAWEPGCKLELFFGGWVKRTYTPASWRDDEVELVAYVHGDGPGARWARDVAVGRRLGAVGPRASLRLGVERPAVLFGDETCLGLLRALRSTVAGRNVVHAALEVTSLAVTRPVLDLLELDGVQLVERAPDDGHLHAVERWLDGVGPISGCVLAGKAQSIQAINRHVRARGLRSAQISTRAYWSPGKRGLD